MRRHTCVSHVADHVFLARTWPTVSLLSGPPKRFFLYSWARWLASRLRLLSQNRPCWTSGPCIAFTPAPTSRRAHVSLPMCRGGAYHCSRPESQPVTFLAAEANGSGDGKGEWTSNVRRMGFILTLMFYFLAEHNFRKIWMGSPWCLSQTWFLKCGLSAIKGVSPPPLLFRVLSDHGSCYIQNTSADGGTTGVVSTGSGEQLKRSLCSWAQEVF